MKTEIKLNSIMKFYVTAILSLFFVVSAIAQKTHPDSGFTNKAEAKNELVNGVKEGKWIEYDTCYDPGDTIGKLCSYRLIIFKSDRPTGTVRQYDISGILKSEIPMKNGKENGMERRYYDSGKLMLEAQYVNDKRNGLEKEYYENGKLKSETNYTLGKAGETKSYDEKGNEIK